MKVASFNYQENKVIFPYGKHLTKGVQRWHFKLWAVGLEHDLKISLTPKKRMDFSDLLPLIEQHIDELIDEIPEGLNMGWEVFTCR